LLVLFEGFCIFGYREAYKTLLCILMVVNKTIHGNNGDVPDILLNMFLSSSPGIRNHMNWRVVAFDPEFPQSSRTILNKQEFIIHNSVTQLFHYSLSTLPTMSTIYDKPGAGWDRIDPDNYFINVCVFSSSGRRELSSDAVPTARGIHPPPTPATSYPHQTPHQPLPEEMLADRCPLGNVDGTVTANFVGTIP
jgi:hypothetical protein